MTLYISYSAVDRHIALDIHEICNEAGIATWIDVKALHPAENWFEGCQAAFKASVGTIGIVSLASLDLQRTVGEWRSTMQNGRALLLISLMSPSDEVRVPPDFRTVNFLRFTNAANTVPIIANRFKVKDNSDV